jgi:HlyD family secretion protein
MWRRATVVAMLALLVGGLSYTQHRDPGTTFITAPVERGTISSVVRATGTVDATATVDVSSQLSGRIAEVFVDFNDTVSREQPLARLDQEIFVARVNEAAAAHVVATASAEVQKAALARARTAVTNAGTAQKLAEAQSEAVSARLDEAERELQRKLTLAGSGTVAARDLGQSRTLRDTSAADFRASVEQITMKKEAIAMAEADVAMAEAALQNAEAVVEQRRATLDQARLDLERSTLRSPIAGVILKRDVNPGQTVAVTLEAKMLFKVANDLRRMEVRAKVDEADVGHLKPGQTATFTVDAYPDQTFTGRVLRIHKFPEVTQNVVTYTAIISAPNDDLLLLPGMTAVLRIVVNNSGEALKIPSEALRFRPASATSMPAPTARTTTLTASAPSGEVWVVGLDGRPEPIAVRTGLSDGSGAQLLEGQLHEGQPLIVGLANSQTRNGILGIRMGF